MYCDWPVLGRCCFCLPLRRGILTFGYINIIFSAFMIGVYGYALHQDDSYILMFHGPTAVMAPPEACIALYCLEIIFNALLVYGTHTKTIPYIKAFYYFSIATTVASFILQVIVISNVRYVGAVIEIMAFMFIGLSIQVYLISLVSGLLKKLLIDGPHVYENPLQQIVSGEAKIEPNGIYNNTTVEPIAD